MDACVYLSTCFYSTGQSLLLSVLSVESTFRCKALLCTPSNLHGYFRNREFMLAYCLWQYLEWWFHVYQNICLKIPNEQQRTCRSRLPKGGENRAISHVLHSALHSSLKSHLPKPHHCVSSCLVAAVLLWFQHEYVVERTCVTAQTPNISSHRVSSHPLT